MAGQASGIECPRPRWPPGQRNLARLRVGSRRSGSRRASDSTSANEADRPASSASDADRAQAWRVDEQAGAGHEEELPAGGRMAALAVVLAERPDGLPRPRPRRALAIEDLPTPDEPSRQPVVARREHRPELVDAARQRGRW